MTNPLNLQLSLQKLQKEFHETFPFLKLEFLGIEKNKEGKRLALDLSKTLKDYLILTEREIDISDQTTVAQLEDMFRTLFGLHAQVFRRSGKLWLETTATDIWTLQYQNEQGKELSTDTLGDSNEEFDYHEQE
jgi:hypothetical protein